VNTNYSIEKSQWDTKRRRVKESKVFPESIEINKEINRLETLYKGEPHHYESNQKPFDFLHVIKYFDIHIELLKSQEKYGTYRKFELVRRYLLKFNEEHKHLNTINRDFLLQFQTWLFKKTKVKQNGVHTYFKTFRNIINKCVQHDLIKFPPEKNPFLNFKIRLEDKEKPKLSEKQLNRIIELDLSKNEQLNKIKNYFLFSFYSGGMRISDLCCLKWGSLKDRRLEYEMRKTNKKVSIPLNTYQISILLSQLNINDLSTLVEKESKLKLKENVIFSTDKTYKIPGFRLKSLMIKEKKNTLDDTEMQVFNLIELMSLKKPNDYVFKILEPKKINSRTDLMKQISSKSTLINKGLKEISIQSEIGIDLSFHISRHTFSDLMRKAGKSIYDISKILGHSDIGITENYLKSLDYDSTDEVVVDFYNNL
jgi:integrase